MTNHDRFDASNEEGYDHEDDLQALIAHDHSLLCGNQITPDNPRRWILVDREVNITPDPNGAYRWRVDHLFIDQDGLPTIVEAKRGKNREKRRTIVGQVLEYAAYSAFFPREDIRAMFEANTNDPVAELGKLFGSEASDDQIDHFWNTVCTNLAEGRLRLMLVADDLPDETRRVAGFLNDRLCDIAVFAIKVENPSATAGDAPPARIVVSPNTVFDKIKSEERPMLPVPSLQTIAPWTEKIEYYPKKQKKSGGMTLENLYQHLPSSARTTMLGLVEAAYRAGACFETEKYSLVISAKTDLGPQRPIKLIWLDPPEPQSHGNSWGVPENFTFGYVGSMSNEHKPNPALRKSLDKWINRFESGSYKRRPSQSIQNKQWVLNYDQVANEIESLCKHLIATIKDIGTQGDE